MSKRIYPYGSIKYWLTYDIDDVCDLYSDCGLHPQTVRTWIRKGLKTIDNSRPTLFYGYDLIAFIKSQNLKNKCKTSFDEMFCMSCKDARNIFKRNITMNQKNNFLQVSGLCRSCKKPMFKNYKMDDFQKLKRTFHKVDVLELYDCDKSSCKTHLSASLDTPASESNIWTPYGDLFK